MTIFHSLERNKLSVEAIAGQVQLYAKEPGLNKMHTDALEDLEVAVNKVVKAIDEAMELIEDDDVLSAFVGLTMGEKQAVEAEYYADTHDIRRVAV